MDTTKDVNGESIASSPMSEEFTYPADTSVEGDYSTQMRELLGSDMDITGFSTENDVEEEEEEESFVYAGVDAEDTEVGYNDQLRDVLGSDADSEVQGTLLVDPEQGDDLVASDDELLNESPESAPSLPSRPVTPVPDSLTSSLQLPRPVLHPNVSRLRSYTPQLSVQSLPSSPSASFLRASVSPSPSHFSTTSATSSVSHLYDSIEGAPTKIQREVFRWTSLHNIRNILFSQTAQKASSILGSPSPGVPTVLAANGLICIGTENGLVAVYDFKQTLKCVCGDSSVSKGLGSVTALAISYDHTYIAVGHSMGHIQLFDLKNPRSPARNVPPTTLAAVSSGRKEGHIQGSKIVSIGFVAGRHTAIVSADEHGLAFSHTLGKVLFVEAADILRILGRYPIELAPNEPAARGLTPSSIQQRKSRYCVLGMMPLPLGTTHHATDAFNLVALLTPTKLVVAGLKPTPKTWFKCPRSPNIPPSKGSGTLVWFPSVTVADSPTPTAPRLAYCWANVIYVLQVSEVRTPQTNGSAKSSKTAANETSSIMSETIRSWTTESDVLALQWMNAKQIVAFTSTHIYLFDIGLSQAVERTEFHASILSPFNSRPDISHSAHRVRTHKGKIFVLARDDLQAGTLLTWADRVLAFVQQGDFLGAIDLVRSYYEDVAPGNKNGLPEDYAGRKAVTSQKMKELMVASSRYAFSEERMTDGTHSTPDGRGVDRTPLFEGMVTTCTRACIALEDFDFLFEDLFQQYDDAGIARIFLLQLEPFILDGSIKTIPVWISQRLLRLQEDDGHPDLIERLIWHIDPACLDLHQAVQLCQRHRLYDALIYVYTRGFRDFVAPVVELIALIRQINRFRRQGPALVDPDMESKIMNAYKVYPYISNTLTGLTYPSEAPLDLTDALQAKKDVYGFIFFGHSSVWPPGEGGQLVLTSDEEDGAEPTYPYARLLLRFDPESFLHSLDIAFEDPYLNDESQGGRLLIVRVLLEILTSNDLPPAAVTFVHIFVARNIPKYPQFLHVAPTQLHNILIGLAQDPDPGTREDRQLAVEYLLSVYNPHDSDYIMLLFKEAGFYRILRSHSRSEHKWSSLLLNIVQDPDLFPSELLRSADEAFDAAARGSGATILPDMAAALQEGLPRLLRAGIADTASLVDRRCPSLHDQALDELDDNGQYSYLQSLLQPDPEGDDSVILSLPPSINVRLEAHHTHQYIGLQCRFDPDRVVSTLKTLPPELLEWTEVIAICEKEQAFDAAVWSTYWLGDPHQALVKAGDYEESVVKLAQGTDIDPSQLSQRLRAIVRSAVAVCLEGTHQQSSPNALEDMWFQLLSNQIYCIENASAQVKEQSEGSAAQVVLESLRNLVQEAFTALVSVSMSRRVSFPRLFKRLVSQSRHLQEGSHYSEFRSILSSMLESYHSDEDILVITKHLINRDLFDLVDDLQHERLKGWRPMRGVCAHCYKALVEGSGQVANGSIVVSRKGHLFHSSCWALKSSDS